MSGARPWVLLAPALLVLAPLTLGALAMAVLRSLGIGGLAATPGLGAYAAVLGDPDVWRAAGLSLWIATAATAISAALALPVALALRERGPGRGAVRAGLHLTLTVPHLVAGLGVLYLAGQSGSLARLAHALGLIAGPAEFPVLTQDPAAIGIIAAYVWKELPFVAVILGARLATLGPEPEEAARSLGATRLAAFRHVTLPALAPGLVAAGAVVFAFTFGAYEVPALLGRSYPEALPVAAWRAFTDVDLARRAEAMALSVLIAALSGAALWAYLRALRR